jgi:hypothetical protein
MRAVSRHAPYVGGAGTPRSNNDEHLTVLAVAELTLEERSSAPVEALMLVQEVR